MSTARITPAIYRRIEPRAGLQWVALLGGAAIAGAAAVVQPTEGWSGILTAALFGVTLAMGGAVFVAVQAAAGARWWFSVRGIPLLLARTLAVPATALVLCFALGLQALYPWARPGAFGPDSPLHGKEAWLNAPLFLARALVILVVWFGLIARLRQRLGDLCQEPSAASHRRFARASIGFLVVYAVTCSVASWDWFMSLEPAWFSTMYSVYVFAGTLLGGIAAVTLLALLLERAGLLDGRLEPDVVHDLGKLLFAFSTFWAYIWFCQYLLVWYSNLPEETGHYAARLTGGFSTLFHLNAVLNWVVPFVALLGAGAKRRTGELLQVAAVVLVGRWLDVFLLVAPSAGPLPAFPVAAVAASVAVLGGIGMIWRRGLLRVGPESGIGPRPD